MQFEKGAYEECIADCDKAVERGRELRADYKLVAKAFTRKGNALVKTDQLPEAISVYHKALTEHRYTPCATPLRSLVVTQGTLSGPVNL